MLVLIMAASSVLFAAEVSAAPAKSAPIAEAPAPATPLSGVTVKADDDKRMVCKTAPPTGTRLPGKRTCMSRGEWEARATEAKKDLMDRQSRTAGPRSS